MTGRNTLCGFEKKVGERGEKERGEGENGEGELCVPSKRIGGGVQISTSCFLPQPQRQENLLLPPHKHTHLCERRRLLEGEHDDGDRATDQVGEGGDGEQQRVTGEQESEVGELSLGVGRRRGWGKRRQVEGFVQGKAGERRQVGGCSSSLESTALSGSTGGGG